MIMKRYLSVVALICVAVPAMAKASYTEGSRTLNQKGMLSDHSPVELQKFMSPEKTQTCVYTDASVFPLYGQIDDDVETRYERLPVSLKGVSRPDILRLGRKSAGMFLRFRSNTTSVWVRWAALYDNEQNHMTDTGTRGLDLYALIGGEWKAVAPVRPDTTGLNECRVIRNMEPIEREYMLYLPLYDGIKSLEIGVDADAFIDQPAVDSPSTEKPIVMYGSSILQGGCASRPGMAYTNILGRRFDRVVYNLGFSGNARLDMEIAELMAQVEDPGAFVLDYVPNTPYTLIEEAGEKLFRILRDAHPDVPVIFVEDPIFPRSEFDKKLQQEVVERNPTQYKLYKKLKKAGEKKLYYVSADKMLGDDGEATADGSHFTDLGMMRYVENIMPVMKKALK